MEATLLDRSARVMKVRVGDQVMEIDMNRHEVRFPDTGEVMKARLVSEENPPLPTSSRAVWLTNREARLPNGVVVEFSTTAGARVYSVTVNIYSADGELLRQFHSG